MFTKKILSGAIFLLAPAANMFGTSHFFYWLDDLAACCFFGADLANGLDHNFPSRLTNGTPDSSSDLLCSSVHLRFTRTNYSKSNSLSPFYSLGQIDSKSSFSSLFTPDKNVLIQNSPFSLLFLD